MKIMLPMNTAILYSVLTLFSSSHAADFELGFEINTSKEIFNPFDFSTFPGNYGWDSLGMNNSGRGVDFTGNGSGDPTKTVFRQVMGDGTWDAQSRTWSCGSGEFCSEILKGHLNGKAGGSIINTVTLTDPSDDEFFRVDGDFDMATDTQAGRSVVTAGSYVYNNCSNPSCTRASFCSSKA